MKLCKDCKHYRRSWLSTFWNPHEFAKCKAPQTAKIDLLSGHITHQPEYAVNTREYRCGENGKFWEAK